MHKFPTNFNASVFIGHTLDMVSFNISQIYLHFDDKVMVTVEGTLNYQTAQKNIQTLTPPVASSNLMSLVGHKVIQASAKADGTLSLLFDDQSIIECFNTEGNYESYQITIGKNTIVI